MHLQNLNMVLRLTTSHFFSIYRDVTTHLFIKHGTSVLLMFISIFSVEEYICTLHSTLGGVGVVPNLDHVVTLARLVHVDDVHVVREPHGRAEEDPLGIVLVKRRCIQLVGRLHNCKGVKAKV